MNISKFIPLFFLFFLFPLFTCSENDSYIPEIYVNFNVNLNDPEFFALNASGNYVIVNGGLRGIVIYRKSFDEFLALDLTCTFDPKEDCATLKPNTVKNFIFEDLCCGSQFSMLLDGFPVAGPAKLPMKQYNVSFNASSQILYINN